MSQPQTLSSKLENNEWLPGTQSSISFLIENKERTNKTYDVVVKTSSNTIVPIITQKTIELESNNQELYILALQISSQAISGSYEISILLKDHDSKQVTTLTKIIQVAAFQKITVTNIFTPEYLKAGDTLNTSFLIENLGNVTEKLKLESNGKIISNLSEIELKPGESKTIKVYQLTNSSIPKNDNVNIRIVATSFEDPQKNWTAYASGTILAVNPKEDDAYYRFPIKAAVAYIGLREQDFYKGGFQAEISGQGSLNNKNTSSLEFHFITPGPIPFNSYSKYEEYMVGYQNKNWLFRLGDQTYATSYLTEYSRYGRGAEIQFHTKGIKIGGFYNVPRFFKDIKSSIGAYSGISIGNETAITAGYYYKTPDTVQQNIFSPSPYKLREVTHLPFIKFESKFLNRRLVLNTEVAHSQSAHTKGNAYFLQLAGNFKNINGNFQWVNASPEFNGYFKNTSNLNANLGYSFLKKLKLNINYYKDARNVQKDTLFLMAPFNKNYYAGISYQYHNFGSISVYGGDRLYEDRMEIKKFDYNEKYFRISWNQKVAAINFNIETQWGRTNNYLLGINGNFKNYSGNIDVQKFNSTLSVFSSYTVSSRYQQKNQKQVYYGARLSALITSKSQLNISYQNNFQIEEYYRDRNLFEILYGQQVLRNHRLELAGRYALRQGNIGKEDFIASAKYIVNINAPVQKIAVYTKVRGNIKDIITQKGKNIRVLLNGKITETDKEGNFIFKNVVPGNYIFDIDRSSMAIDEIADIQLPVQLQVSKLGEVINLGITNAASIKGYLDVEKEQKGIGLSLESIDDKQSAANQVIVEVTDGVQIFRKLCNIYQPFDFTYLKPGNWTVKIYRNGLDKMYKILTDTFNFELKPSDQKAIKVSIIKKNIEVKYQQEEIKVSYNN